MFTSENITTILVKTIFYFIYMMCMVYIQSKLALRCQLWDKEKVFFLKTGDTLKEVQFI